MAAGKRWTRGELLVALNLYHKLTFGQLDARTPAIQDVARKLGRSANSLSMKLNNFASLDPALRLRGIRGLTGASALDNDVWNEFHTNLEELAPESEAALRELFEADEQAEVSVVPKKGVVVRKRIPTGETEAIVSAKQRRGQDYFRNAVLNNFGGRCGITGLEIRSLLVASHILPWATYRKHRLDVRNGICLSRLHDAAFDCGLIAFNDSLRLMLSPSLKAELPQKCLEVNFVAYEGEPLKLPDDAALPNTAFLAKHREILFSKH